MSVVTQSLSIFPPNIYIQCYFLSSASPATPIIYSVERLREGRSYVARSVKAIQNGQIIFIMLCSFQKPEPWQPSHSWGMPAVPTPDECELEEDRYDRMLQDDALHPRVKEVMRQLAWVSRPSVLFRIGFGS